MKVVQGKELGSVFLTQLWVNKSVRYRGVGGGGGGLILFNRYKHQKKIFREIYGKEKVIVSKNIQR